MTATRLFILIVLISNPIFAQMPAKGMLLVATEDMRDSRFSKTVILLVHHEPQGVLGVAINRPTWVVPSTVFPNMTFMEEYNGSIFVGGPMARTNVLALFNDNDIEIPGVDSVFDNVYMSTDPTVLQNIIQMKNSDTNLRLFAGHASWEVRQLNRELAAGQWKVVQATTDFVFAQEPLRIWDELQHYETEISVKLMSPNKKLVSLTLP